MFYLKDQNAYLKNILELKEGGKRIKVEKKEVMDVSTYLENGLSSDFNDLLTMIFKKEFNYELFPLNIFSKVYNDLNEQEKEFINKVLDSIVIYQKGKEKTTEFKFTKQAIRDIIEATLEYYINFNDAQI